MAASTGAPDPASTAPGLLRHLRRRAGLTQFALAERCGVSDRTVRGLETGRIRYPQQTTLRLLADALELTGRERTKFQSAWQSERGRVWLDTLLAKGRDTDVELSRRLHEQYETIREITHWSRRTIGPDRRATHLGMRRGFVVERGSVDSWLFAYGRTPSNRIPAIVATENCRFHTAHDYGPNAWLLEFAFDRAIGAGEGYSFTFELEHDANDALRQPQTTEALVAIAANLPALNIEVQFDGDVLPVDVRHVTKPLLEDQITVVRPVSLSPFDTAHLVLEHPDPGFYGLRWAWPD